MTYVIYVMKLDFLSGPRKVQSFSSRSVLANLQIAWFHVHVKFMNEELLQTRATHLNSVNTLAIFANILAHSFFKSTKSNRKIVWLLVDMTNDDNMFNELRLMWWQLYWHQLHVDEVNFANFTGTCPKLQETWNYTF